MAFLLNRWELGFQTPVHGLYNINLINSKNHSIMESVKLLQILLIKGNGAVPRGHYPQHNIAPR